MVRFNKILVPTDFGDGSRVAYTYANEFAAKFGGKVDLLHVIPTMKYLTESISKLGLPLDMDSDIYPKLIDQSRGYIEDDLTNFIKDSAKGQAFVKIDMKAYEVIVDTAKNEPYDMVVVGAHGLGSRQLLKGNVTEKVIRYSNVPVLCVPPQVPTERIKRIVVPIDFSENSWEAMLLAASFAASIEGELTLLHVKELYGSEGSMPPHTSSEDEISLIRKELVKNFAEYAKRDTDFHFEITLLADKDYDLLTGTYDGKKTEVKLHTVVRKGISAHYEITDYANENADMVVMTTHGRSALKHVFLGSTTEKVARYTKIPILTIRPGKHK
jgi:nucleotide-binding universal stress UspA family protein